jgi:hypothetical protein
VKKAPLLITLGLFLLVAGSFFVYQYFFSRHTTSIFEMVPEQAVLIYEPRECQDCELANRRSNINQLIERLLLDANGGDSLIKTFDFLFSPKTGKAISLHVVSKDDFDAVYYFTGKQANLFYSVISQWKDTRGIRFTERELNGFKILEFGVSERLFSCVQLEDAWAGSFTPFLIEDVVRTFEARDDKNLKRKLANVYALPHVKDDAGDIYVHLGNVIRLLKVFPESFSSRFMELGDAGLLDIKQTENSIILNGFSLAKKNDNNSLLSYFEDQAPVQFTIKQYISNQTLVGVNYGISDGPAFYEKLALSRNKPVLDSLNAFATIDYQKLFSSLGKEMAVCYLESGGEISSVVVFETQKPSDWIGAFDQLAEESRKEDTVFYEDYSTYVIREIGINNFSGKLFDPLVTGSATTYYSSIGNYVILSGSIESMKAFLEDIDQENVWGKSVAFNKFAESTLLESNFSVYVNTPLVWSNLTERLSAPWKQFVHTNQPLLNSFDFGAIQFSHLNESFYTNVTWTYSDYQETGKKKNLTPSDRLVASFGSPIISKPTIVKSHVSGDDEVLVQDSSYVLYHLSSDGKVLWQKDIHEPVVGKIYQVDFYANGKLQFFFATTNKLHIVDRLGNYVSAYPREVKTRDISSVTLVDYDKSKKYRFLLADKAGKLWMFDKEAANLEGWTPLNAGGDLISSPRHYRIRGKDYILAIRKDGYACLTTRRGEMIKGFPLNLEARPMGEFYLEPGNSITTNFVCVSKDGFRIRFNLQGQIMSRETLIKPSFETQFSLIAEQHGKSYVIKRQDTKRLSVLKPDGTEIFSNATIGLNETEVKYYDFGAGKVFFTLTDLDQELSFIYDSQGNLLTSTPLQGTGIELRPTRNEMPKIFLVDRNALIIQ